MLHLQALTRSVPIASHVRGAVVQFILATQPDAAGTMDQVRRYIRFGPNQNAGAAQTDIFVVDAAGNVDRNTPIIWDFARITDITALPMDGTTLRLTGGRFTTIANQAESRYTYYNRNLAIRRSNVVVDGLEHRVTGEGEAQASWMCQEGLVHAASSQDYDAILFGAVVGTLTHWVLQGVGFTLAIQENPMSALPLREGPRELEPREQVRRTRPLRRGCRPRRRP